MTVTFPIHPIAVVAIALLVTGCTDRPALSAPNGPHTDVAAAVQWVVAETDLGTLGGLESYASDINDRGLVVGRSQDAAGVVRAFVWTADQGMRDIGTLGGRFSLATGVSNAGHVVGSSETAAGENHAFIWTQASGMQDLGTLGGTSSAAYDVNSLGEVIGEARNALDELRGFRWTAATGMQEIRTPSPYAAQPFAISERGAIVGQWVNTELIQMAFIRSRDGVWKSLGTMGADVSGATDINSRHVIVGGLWTGPFDERGLQQAFIWREPGLQRVLRPLGGGRNSAALAINDVERVVGTADIEQQGCLPACWHAVLWLANATTPIDLTPSNRSGAALAINLGGQIVGHRDVSPVWCCRGRATMWTVDDR